MLNGVLKGGSDALTVYKWYNMSASMAIFWKDEFVFTDKFMNQNVTCKWHGRMAFCLLNIRVTTEKMSELPNPAGNDTKNTTLKVNECGYVVFASD